MREEILEVVVMRWVEVELPGRILARGRGGIKGLGDASWN